MKKLLCLLLLLSFVAHGQDQQIDFAQLFKDAGQQEAFATDKPFALEKQEFEVEQAFGDINSLVNQLLESGMSYEEIEKRLDFSSMMLNRGGGMDSGGGDAVIIYDSYSFNIHGIEAGYRVFALDLVEFGIQDDPYIAWRSDEGKTIYSYWDKKGGGSYLFKVHLNVTDSELFDELMEYDGFFGKEVGPSKFDVLNTLLEVAPNSQEIEEIYDEKQRLLSEISKMNSKFSKGIAYDKEKRSRINKKIGELTRRYDREVAKYSHMWAGKYYSPETKVAVGLTTKIEEIREVNSDFADLFEDVLLDLEWQIVDLPVKEIDDEGEISIEIDKKIQIASRKDGVVRIFSEGWTEPAIVDGQKVNPMDYKNKIALITHEVLYEITKRQGDVTSERARNATARLFMESRPERNIRKAAALIMR